MDKLAQKFIANGADPKALLKEAEKAAGKVDKDAKDNAKLYVAFMKKAVEKVSCVGVQIRGEGAARTSAVFDMRWKDWDTFG